LKGTFYGAKMFFDSSWVKKNIKETYGGDEEVSDLCLVGFDTVKQLSACFIG